MESPSTLPTKKDLLPFGLKINEKIMNIDSDIDWFDIKYQLFDCQIDQYL
ncbi:MAG: hypothetical protein ACTSQY_02325 [Candidatus Odinarchaeia archaeon]